MNIKKEIRKFVRKSKNLLWASRIATALQEAQQVETKDEETEAFERLIEIISSEIEDAFPTELLRRDTVVYSREADLLLKEILRICSALHSKLPEPVDAFETCLFKIFSKVTYIGVTKLSQNMCSVADLLKEMTKLLLKIPFHPSQDHPENRKQQVLKLCQNFMTMTQSQAPSEEDCSDEENETRNEEANICEEVDEAAPEDNGPMDASPISLKTEKQRKRISERVVSAITPVEQTSSETIPAEELPAPKKKKKKTLHSSTPYDGVCQGLDEESFSEISVIGGLEEGSDEIGTQLSEKKKEKKRRKERTKSSAFSESDHVPREARHDEHNTETALECGQNQESNGVGSVPGESPKKTKKKKKKKKEGEKPSSLSDDIECFPEAVDEKTLCATEVKSMTHGSLVYKRSLEGEVEQPEAKSSKKRRKKKNEMTAPEELPVPAEEMEAIANVDPEEEEEPRKRKKKKRKRGVLATETAIAELASETGYPSSDDNLDDLDATPRLTHLFESPRDDGDRNDTRRKDKAAEDSLKKARKIPSSLQGEEEQPEAKSSTKKRKKKEKETTAPEELSVPAEEMEAIADVHPEEEEEPRKKKKKKRKRGVLETETAIAELASEAGCPSPNEMEAVADVRPEEEEEPRKKKRKKRKRGVLATETAIVELGSEARCPSPDDNFDDLDASPRLTQQFESPRDDGDRNDTSRKDEAAEDSPKKATKIPMVPPYWLMEDNLVSDSGEDADAADSVNLDDEVKGPSPTPVRSPEKNQAKVDEVSAARRCLPAVMEENSNADLFADASQRVRGSPVPAEIRLPVENADNDNAESGYEEELNDFADGDNSMDSILNAEDEDPKASSQSPARAAAAAAVEDAGGLAPVSSPALSEDVQFLTPEISADSPLTRLAEVQPESGNHSAAGPTDGRLSESLQPPADEGRTTAEPHLASNETRNLETREAPSIEAGQCETEAELPVGSINETTRQEFVDCKSILDCLMEQKKPAQSELLDEDIEFIEEIKTMTAGWERDEASSEEEIDWDQIAAFPQSPAKPNPDLPPVRRSSRLASRRKPEELKPPKKVKRPIKRETPSSASIMISTEPVTFMDRLMQHLPACWIQRLRQEDPQSFCAPAPHDHLVHLPCVGGELCHPYEHQHTIRMPCTCYGGSLTPYGADTPTSMPVSASWADKDVVSTSENEDQLPFRYADLKDA